MKTCMVPPVSWEQAWEPCPCKDSVQCRGREGDQYVRPWPSGVLCRTVFPGNTLVSQAKPRLLKNHLLPGFELDAPGI